MDKSKVDARWQTVEPALNQLQKDLILWFGNTEKIKDAPPMDKFARTYLLAKGVSTTDVSFAPRYEECVAEIESLIEKQLFCHISEGCKDIFLNVVNYPRFDVDRVPA